MHNLTKTCFNIFNTTQAPSVKSVLNHSTLRPLRPKKYIFNLLDYNIANGLSKPPRHITLFKCFFPNSYDHEEISQMHHVHGN
jgi:hypothetical protein